MDQAPTPPDAAPVAVVSHNKYHAQARAMFFKQATLQSRQRFTVVCQVLFPALLVVGAGLPYLLLKNLSFTPAYNPALGPSSNGYSGGYVQWIETYDFSNTGNCFLAPKYGCSMWNWATVVLPSDPAQAAAVGTAYINGSGSGLLGSVKKYRYSSPLRPNASVPFYKTVASAYEMDKEMLSTIIDIAEAVQSSGGWQYQTINGTWWGNEEEVYYKMPTSGIIFDGFSTDGGAVELNVTIQLTLQEYNDYTLQFPGFSEYPYTYFADTLHQLSRGLIRFFRPNFNTTIDSGSIDMYAPWNSFSPQALAAFIGCWLLPIAFSFLSPVYIYTLVYEKQQRLLEMMRIMGLTMVSYWFINYMFFYALYVAVIVMIIIIGYACEVAFFSETGVIVWLLLLFFWGHAQIALSFLMSTWFNKHRPATIIPFFMVFVLSGGAMAINMFVFGDNRAPGIYMIYPMFAFIRGVYLISAGVFNNPPHPLVTASLTADSEMAAVYGWLIGETVVYLLLAAYLDQVLPREHGVRLSPIFPIKWLVAWIKERRAGRGPGAFANLQDEFVWSAPLENGFKEDDDCADERRRAHDPAVAADAKILLRVVDVNKTFPPAGGKGTKTALASLCLAVERGECFGLLGPNGAGKSTLATILSGLIAPTSGDAFVAGNSIRENMYKVHQVLGYCPQHDILWEDLTVEEHLLFYIRLKGNAAYADESRMVYQAIMSVNLNEKAKAQVKTLSGGQKRRLSIAISLVGSPKLVLLDEPTTGLDPETRREIWNIVSEQKATKSIILTTHNMEEADVLCSRIGILSRGQLTCIGTPLYLKNRYGKGYHLSITAADVKREEQAQQYIMRLFPNAVLEGTFSGVLSFQVPREDLKLGPFFEEISAHKQANGILEWGLSQTTIEEVFLKILQMDENAASD
eukprot:TRINITY_DN1353_c0_g1_i1.p1 TRINITY_DN1353_c0_g1~~TRINITY_DN1353_c0_g1_i1.p1  ORF type:complete len:911 (+),score=324.01 TRINITY_DN1353_c0_g1_i1:92-2824(+)